MLTASLLISFVSVLLGEAPGRTLPTFWVDLLAEALFIGFGFWSLRGEGENTGTRVDLEEVHSFKAMATSSRAFS